MSIIDRLKHILGVHKYRYVKRLSADTHLIDCSICKKLFAMNTSVHVLVPWDLELEDFYYKKKIR